MYESFFGLTGLPFKITPDDRVFYGGAQRQDMLDALIYTIERGEGLVTVIGEVGTGKTTIARVLSKRLPASVSLASIYMPNVQPLDMLYMIAQELSLSLPTHQPKYVIVEAIRDHLLKQKSEGKRTLLLIDEAQTMPLETLEELRLLSNMQADDFKLLQIMLFGQQELDQVLNSPQVRQVKDRIVYHLDLKPFSVDELAEYLEFRMRNAGYRGETFFTNDVVAAIYQLTKGFPRAVNKLADHVLMSAFAQQSHKVTLTHVGVPIYASSIHFRERIPEWATYIKRSLAAQISLGVLGLVVIVLLFVLMFSKQYNKDVRSQVAFNTVAPVLHVTEPDASSVLSSTETLEQVPLVAERAPEKTQLSLQGDAKLVADTKQVAPVKRNTLGYWQNSHDKTLTQIELLMKEDRYSIQVMSDPWRLRDEFSVVAHALARKLPDNATFMTDYVLSDGRPRIALLYGVYNSTADAQNALGDLPMSVKSYSPVVVSLRQVYAQMKKSTVLQMEP